MVWFEVLAVYVVFATSKTDLHVKNFVPLVPMAHKLTTGFFCSYLISRFWQANISRGFNFVISRRQNMKKRALHFAKKCQQNFMFIKLHKGNELSTYTVQRDYFIQERLTLLRTLKTTVIRSSDSFCSSKHHPDPQKDLWGEVCFLHKQ